jgi:high-affinity nickel permease
MAFGLGFDTASEVGLLVPAVQSLPTLFAAGITHIEITDGVLMSERCPIPLRSASPT